MTSNNFSRRSFLGTALAVGVASPLVIPRSVLAQPGQTGANDKIIVGFVGTGFRAKQLMSHISQRAGEDCRRRRFLETENGRCD